MMRHQSAVCVSPEPRMGELPQADAAQYRIEQPARVRAVDAQPDVAGHGLGHAEGGEYYDARNERLLGAPTNTEAR